MKPRRLVRRWAHRLNLIAYCERCDRDVYLPHAEHAGSLTPYDRVYRGLRDRVEEADRIVRLSGGYLPSRISTVAYTKRDPLPTRVAVKVNTLLARGLNLRGDGRG